MPVLPAGKSIWHDNGTTPTARGSEWKGKRNTDRALLGVSAMHTQPVLHRDAISPIGTEGDRERVRRRRAQRHCSVHLLPRIHHQSKYLSGPTTHQFPTQRFRNQIERDSNKNETRSETGGMPPMTICQGARVTGDHGPRETSLDSRTVSAVGGGDHIRGTSRMPRILKQVLITSAVTSQSTRRLKCSTVSPRQARMRSRASH